MRGPGSTRWPALFALALATAASAPALADAPPGDERAETGDGEGEDAPDARAEAEARFYRGLSLFREEKWGAALAEFRRSIQLFPTRAATRNAAMCLRRLGRPDEALAHFEALGDFELPPEERTLVDRAIAELTLEVGEIEVLVEEHGAIVFVDDVERGSLPLTERLRVPAGARVLRLYKAGFLPLEVRVDVPGNGRIVAGGRMRAIGMSGRLRLAEASGKNVDVLIDGVMVGRTPWEGPLEVGAHVVVLRGEGLLGSQPVSVPVRLGEVMTLSVAVEPLPSDLAVRPSPAGARVRIDGVPVGRGVWQGRVREGEHRIEVTAEGHWPAERKIRLEAGATESLVITLERNLEAETKPRSSRVFVDLAAAGALSPSLGSDFDDASCDEACTAGPALGLRLSLTAGYELASGIGVGVGAGYLRLRQGIDGRSGVVRELPSSAGREHQATFSDRLLLQGLTLGVSAGLRRGETWPWTLRVGGGVLVGSVADRRSGELPAEGVALDPHESRSAAQFAYVAPEARIARRLGELWEVGIGLEALVLIGTGSPRWVNDERNRLVIPRRGERGGFFAENVPDQALVGRTLLVLSPGVHLRADF